VIVVTLGARLAILVVCRLVEQIGLVVDRTPHGGVARPGCSSWH
jgi:hypothetical protein